MRNGKGSHVVWSSPAGNGVVEPAHQDVSPGVIRDIIAKLNDLPKGWLQ